MPIPYIGLGTRQLTGELCFEVVQSAIQLGYHHIDTASVYHNEATIGQARISTGAQRHNLWFTTKLFVTEYKSPQTVREAVQKSLLDLQVDYLDLVLLHRPTNLEEHHRVFDILMEYQSQGIIRHIGVSNFNSEQLLDAIEYTDGKIYAYQGEYHICMDQAKILEICRSNDILFEAYCPLGHGKLMTHPQVIEVINRIADKHDCTAAQVMLSWLRNQKVVILPKTSKQSHLMENMMISEIGLDDDDLYDISSLPKNLRFCSPEQLAPKRD